MSGRQEEDCLDLDTRECLLPSSTCASISENLYFWIPSSLEKQEEEG